MQRMQRIYTTALITLALSTAHAGFYVGAGLGPNSTNFKHYAHFTQPGAHGANVIQKTPYGGTGIFGTLFSGYEYLHNHYVLAAEINGNVNSVSVLTSNKNYSPINFTSTSYAIKNNFGVSILPGYQVSKSTQLYGRLGYVNGEVRIKGNDNSLTNISHRRNGFRPGLGIKHQLTEHVALRMEYSQALYAKTNMRVSTPNSTADMGAFTKSTTVTPQQQTFEFGIVLRS